MFKLLTKENFMFVVQPLELIAHRKTLRAFCFSHNSPTLLASGASDYIIVWNVDEAKKCARNGEYIIERFSGQIMFMCLSVRNKFCPLLPVTQKWVYLHTLALHTYNL